jgi:hypothetical protein
MTRVTTRAKQEKTVESLDDWLEPPEPEYKSEPETSELPEEGVDK